MDLVYALIARATIYADLRAEPLSEPDRVRLFANQEAATFHRQTRHKSLNTLRKYIRDRSLFRNNPAAKLGL